jgi:beta-glucosidase
MTKTMAQISEAPKMAGRRPAPLVFLACSFAAWAQTPAYKNPDLPAEQRAADLVSRMTLDEKVLQMQDGFQGRGEPGAPAIPRLDIAAYDFWNEALHGVARAGEATVFPQAIGLAASWDTDMMHRVADTISTEARAKYNQAMRDNDHSRYHGLTFWSPNINIFRDPRWGRGQETYGEDPFLTGRMAVAFIKGMQGDDPHYYKVIATAKHFAVHSGPESTRHTVDVKVSTRDLEETYLPAFHAAVVEGKVDSVMCAYNSIDGAPACANSDLLQNYLRGKWGFQGFVVSDCGAVTDIFRGHAYKPDAASAAAVAVKTGTDFACDTQYRALVDAVKAGQITEAEIDTSLKRLFVARMELGMFDPPDRVPFSKIPISENDSEEHRKLALEAARKSIVLLKNENQTLPVRTTVKRIAVIGPSADDVDAARGNYNGFSVKEIAPLEGIVKQFAGKAEVHYALGATYTDQSMAMVPVSALQGIIAEYFDNPDLQGQPKLRRAEARPYYQPGAVDPAVAAAGIPPRGFSVRWSGTLKPPVTGDYDFGRLSPMLTTFLDDLPFPPLPTDSPGPVVHLTLEAGRSYKLRIEYRARMTGTAVRFQWIPPEAPLLAEAVDAVKNADLTVAFVGLNPNLEGEEMRVNIPGFSGGDRTDLNLPAQQERLIEAAIATGKPVVVVLTSGSAIAANYAAEHAAALLEAWYNGEEAGTAIAETLAGVNNPAGRLPVTFYERVDQLPKFDDYAMKGRTYRYFTGDALYGFGFGLSYSKFTYSGLRTQRNATGAKVSVRVKNDSTREGDEVVQLYVSGAGGADDPIRNLRGFQRVHLRAGETREVEFTLGSADVPKDKVKISVGGGQPVGQIAHIDGTL